MRIALPETDGYELILILSVAGHPAWNSRYRLSLRPVTRRIAAATRVMNS
ncbi:MAG: hypothetical protein ABW223_13190 [Rariglobus sp.]